MGGVVILSILTSCRATSFDDPLAVLPPPCRFWTAPHGDSGCLVVRDDKNAGFELRYRRAGAVATVTETTSAGESLTEVKLNGATTWQRRVERASDNTWHTSVISEFEYPTGRLLREERYRNLPSGHAFEAKARRARIDHGAAEASWQDSFPPSVTSDDKHSTKPKVQQQNCSPYETEALQADLKDALRAGTECLAHHQRIDIAALILSRYQRGPLVLACVQSSAFSATADVSSYLGLVRATKVSFDKTTYFDGPAGGRTPTTAHELLHFWTGPHAPYVGIDTRSTDPDRTEACVSLCFASARRVSKCECSLCLGVPRDDSRCSGFVDCSQ